MEGAGSASGSWGWGSALGLLFSVMLVGGWVRSGLVVPPKYESILELTMLTFWRLRLDFFPPLGTESRCSGSAASAWRAKYMDSWSSTASASSKRRNNGRQQSLNLVLSDGGTVFSTLGRLCVRCEGDLTLPAFERRSERGAVDLWVESEVRSCRLVRWW